MKLYTSNNYVLLTFNFTAIWLIKKTGFGDAGLDGKSIKKRHDNVFPFGRSCPGRGPGLVWGRGLLGVLAMTYF